VFSGLLPEQAGLLIYGREREPLRPILVGYWTFNSSAIDWRTNNNTGTLVSLATTTAPVMGKIGQALNFRSAVSSAVQVSALMGSPSSITLSAWAKLNGTDTSASEFISIGDNVALRMDDGVNGTGSFYWAGFLFGYRFLL
jgi:hypothetical protein